MSRLAFRCLNDSARRYLAVECTPVAEVTGRVHRRSVWFRGSLLCQHAGRCRSIRRASVVACPRARNSRPEAPPSGPGISLSVFKKALKFRVIKGGCSMTNVNHYFDTANYVCYFTFVYVLRVATTLLLGLLL